MLIPADRHELIVHHDVAPWNLVTGPRWALIDWDTAAPGSRLWDLAYAIHGFVPLMAHPDWCRDDAAHRMRVFVDAYGLDEQQRRELVPLLATRAQAMHDFLAEQARQGTPPWSTLWSEGHGQVWLADAGYIAERQAQWGTVLLG